MEPCEQPARPSIYCLMTRLPADGTGTQTCTVCDRYGLELQLERHHLIPENRRESPVAMVCSPCYDQLHALFTKDKPRELYHTVEKLRSPERMQKYLSWIRWTAKSRIDVETSHHVREHR